MVTFQRNGGKRCPRSSLLLREHIGDSPEVVSERRRVRGMFPWLDNAPNPGHGREPALAEHDPQDNGGDRANGLVEWLHDPARGRQSSGRPHDAQRAHDQAPMRRAAFEGDNIERIKATRNKKGWAAISRYYADGA